MKAVIRAADGKLNKAAAFLGVSRPTLYAWISQLDLVEFAGVDSKDAIDSKDKELSAREEARKIFVKSEPSEARIVRAVNSSDLRMQRNITVPESLWTWARHRALDAKKTTSEIVEEAIREYRRRLEEKDVKE